MKSHKEQILTTYNGKITLEDLYHYWETDTFSYKALEEMNNRILQHGCTKDVPKIIRREAKCWAASPEGKKRACHSRALRKLLKMHKTNEASTLEQIEMKYPFLINELAKLWQKDRSAKIIQAGIKSQKEHNLLLRAAYEHSALD